MTWQIPATLTLPSNSAASSLPVANKPIPRSLDAKTPKLLTLKPAIATLSPNSPSALNTLTAASGSVKCGVVGSTVVEDPDVEDPDTLGTGFVGSTVVEDPGVEDPN